MSSCIFIASDRPLHEVEPQKEYLHVCNIDEGIIYDGGADDNFVLHTFEDVQSYTDKKYGVYLKWYYMDEKRKY